MYTSQSNKKTETKSDEFVNLPKNTTTKTKNITKACQE